MQALREVLQGGAGGQAGRLRNLPQVRLPGHLSGRLACEGGDTQGQSLHCLQGRRPAAPALCGRGAHYLPRPQGAPVPLLRLLQDPVSDRQRQAHRVRLRLVPGPILRVRLAAAAVWHGVPGGQLCVHVKFTGRVRAEVLQRGLAGRACRTASPYLLPAAVRQPEERAPGRVPDEGRTAGPCGGESAGCQREEPAGADRAGQALPSRHAGEPGQLPGNKGHSCPAERRPRGFTPAVRPAPGQRLPDSAGENCPL